MKVADFKETILHPFKLGKSGRILYIIVLNLILKTAFLFATTFPDDVDFYIATGILFLRGILPYADFIAPGQYSVDFDLMFNSLHPNGPLNYIFYGFWMYAFGSSSWVIKLPWLISEVCIAVIILLIGESLIDIDKGFLAAIFYSLIPMSYFPSLLVGCDELISSLFTVLSVFYFFRSKEKLSSIFLAFGTAYKLFSVFALIPVFLYYFSRKEIKKFIAYMVLFVITFLFLSLPFMIMDLEAFVRWNFGQANRAITISFVSEYRDPIFFGGLFTILGIEISFYTIFQILMVSSYFLFRVSHLRKYRRYSRTDFLIDLCVYFLLLPIISLSNNYRYFFWVLPFLLLLMVKIIHLNENIINFERLFNIQILYLIVITLIVLSQSFVFKTCKGVLSVQCYNDYIPTFAIIYVGYGFTFLFLRDQSKSIKLLKLFILGSVLHGISTVIIYKYWESIQYYWTEDLFLVLSILFFLIGLLVFYSFLFLIGKHERKINQE